MAVYRQIYMSFWTDPKVDDEFTPEDKYFYIYLLSNPHTSICGCYEISMKQMERETGYNSDSILRLLKRMEQTHDVIRYSKETKEVLLLNWHKYNWTKSPTFISSLEAAIKDIKNDAFREYITALVASDDTVSIPYPYGMDTPYTVTVTDTVSKNINNKTIRHKYGVYKNVLLSDEDMDKLKTEFPSDYEERIERVSEYCEQTGKTYKNYLATIRAWSRKEGKANVATAKPVAGNAGGNTGGHGKFNLQSVSLE